MSGSALLTQSDHQRQVGARLRRLIELLDMQQIEAAALMGVSKQTLNNWLRGDSYPAIFPLYRLCRARGVDFNFIMLADWSALPARLARTLDAELSAAMADAPEVDHPAVES